MITVKMWKDLVSFDPIKDGKFDLDGTIERIAKVKGKTIDEIESTTAVEDVLPTFIECVREANDLVFKRLDTIPKNGNGDGQQ